MTPITRSTALLGLALALTTGAAAAQQTTPTPAPDGARAQSQDARGPRHGMRGARGMRGDRGPGPLLRGITLSTAQQQRLKSLDERYATEGRTLREQMRPAAQTARAARQRGDTAAARAAWQGTTDQRRQFAELQQRRLQDVRNVLTADQQQTFDANRAELAKRMTERRAERGTDRKGDRGFRGGRRSQG